MNNRLAFGALAIACIAAAGSGAYLASRYNTPNTTASVTARGPLANQAPTNAAVRPVEETEAVISEQAASSADGSASSQKPTATASRANVAPIPSGTVRPPVLKEAQPRVQTESKRSRATQSSTQASAQSHSSKPENKKSDPGWSGVDKPWPSGNTSTAPAEASTPSSPTDAAAPRSEEHRITESTLPTAPPSKPVAEELVVSAESVIGLQIDTPVTSERAKIEDRVEARVTRDVRVGEKVAIPAGTKVIGSVTQVDRGGKFKERARLGIRFHTLVLADGERVPMNTETLYRDGDSPARESAAKIGVGAVGGAVLGAIFGGAKGAVIGGSAGAAGGSAAVMASDRNSATLPAGANVTVKVVNPVTITVEK